MQVLYKLFEDSPFKPFEAIPFKFHIIYVCAWEKNCGHVNDLGSVCCHQSGKILTCPPW